MISYKTSITINEFIEMRREYEKEMQKQDALIDDALKLAGITRTTPLPKRDYIILPSKINRL